MIVITIISYIVAMLFEIYMFNSTQNIDANAIRAVLKIVLGTMSAIKLFTGSYYGKMSLSNIIDDHRRMIILYDAAEKEIEKNGETEELIVFLAREFLTENSDEIIYKSKFWQNDNDYLQIDVTYSTSNFNADEIAEDIGGEEESMFGYDGYYSEFEDTYSFTFVKDNKLISIYASNYDLLSEIETD